MVTVEIISDKEKRFEMNLLEQQQKEIVSLLSVNQNNDLIKKSLRITRRSNLQIDSVYQNSKFYFAQNTPQQKTLLKNESHCENASSRLDG